MCFPGISLAPTHFAYRNPTGAQTPKHLMLCPCQAEAEPWQQ